MLVACGSSIWGPKWFRSLGSKIVECVAERMYTCASQLPGLFLQLNKGCLCYHQNLIFPTLKVKVCDVLALLLCMFLRLFACLVYQFISHRLVSQ